MSRWRAATSIKISKVAEVIIWMYTESMYLVTFNNWMQKKKKKKSLVVFDWTHKRWSDGFMTNKSIKIFGEMWFAAPHSITPATAVFKPCCKSGSLSLVRSAEGNSPLRSLLTNITSLSAVTHSARASPADNKQSFGWVWACGASWMVSSNTFIHSVTAKGWMTCQDWRSSVMINSMMLLMWTPGSELHFSQHCFILKPDVAPCVTSQWHSLLLQCLWSHCSH